MPIKLSHIVADKRTCSLEYLDETVNITYRPNWLTPALLEELDAFTEEDGIQKAIIRCLPEILISWDVLDEKGKQYPTTSEAIKKLPLRFLTVVFWACVGDLGAGEAKQPSGAGS